MVRDIVYSYTLIEVSLPVLTSPRGLLIVIVDEFIPCALLAAEVL